MSNLGGMGDFARGGAGVKVAHATLKGGTVANAANSDALN